MSIVFDPARISQLKFAYTTRHLRPGLVAGMTTEGSPRAGDVVIARVVEIGQHQRLECTDSRRATLFPGDEIVVCYANRYAPAQYEAVVPTTLGRCDLVAAGGVAATALSRHASKDEPTAIDVLGFATDHDGRRINIADHRTVPTPNTCGDAAARPFTIVIAGTSMDSGKTTTAAGIVKGLVTTGLSVGAAKVTGTGAGNDLWLMADAGARPVVDFTAVGMPSTFMMGHERIVDSFVSLHHHLADAGVDVAVIEIADGLFLSETAALLASDELRARCDGIVFAAGDAAGAQNGVGLLRSLGHDVLAVSGLLTASPLAVRETQSCVDVPVLTLPELWAADHTLLDRAAWAHRLRAVPAATKLENVSVSPAKLAS
ncbi:MAG: hypothetical protein QNJ12_09230 [Ilumatobacter sp.]|uniref:hypothetical protein n=1 Tax=Ilumatobacter sp. TaxID=1967498 RepID=UPI002619A205|nr:hypothetical protein [Ilumatobacter sp.]MDJ0768965.1 hypothetical protein [Ilumatobacter sp.]